MNANVRSGAPVAASRPYEEDAARVRALYRIPVSASLDRILEVQATSREPTRKRPAPVFAGEATVWDARAPVGALTRPGGYRLLVLHRTLDVLARDAQLAGDAFDAAGFIRRISGALAPDGWVAGCVANRYSLATWLGRATRHDGRATFTVRSCKHVLEGSGLQDVEIFAVFPDAMAPTALLSLDADAFREFSRRELDARRAWLSRQAYLARRAFLGTAAGRFLSADIFFWGRRP
ncbi:MAG TPA: hypothetical protein VFR59_10475 [Steroidobacteraceae bacterium]|nr:hypothetical protein [Steroidobacteraceae bacterium]